MTVIRKQPTLPNDSDIPPGLKAFFSELDKWLQDVYSKLSKQNLRDVVITSNESAPSGGKDGDLHIRVNGASTALYININGVWSAYTNP